MGVKECSETHHQSARLNNSLCIYAPVAMAWGLDTYHGEMMENKSEENYDFNSIKSLNYKATDFSINND